MRERWKLAPESRKTRRIVAVETLGRPSGAARSVFRRFESDQVAVPSALGVGVRAASAAIRAASSGP